MSNFELSLFFFLLNQAPLSVFGKFSVLFSKNTKKIFRQGCILCFGQSVSQAGNTACLKKWYMWKCAILINNFSIFSTAFYMIFKITKLALKYRVFHRICFCHSRDMFD